MHAGRLQRRTTRPPYHLAPPPRGAPQVVLGPYMGASNDYIRRAVEVEIWQLNEW